MKKAIGERIRKIRVEQDFSQADMAIELDLSPGAFAKIERGETDPSITRLYQIAEILAVSIYDLLEDNPDKKKIKNESILELQIFKLLTEMEVLKKELKKIPNGK